MKACLRATKARLKDFDRIFLPQSQEVRGCQVYQIHEPMGVWPGAEVDHWVRTKRNRFLLRLAWSEERKLTLYKHDARSPVYAIVNGPFEGFTPSEVDLALALVLKVGVPHRVNRRWRYATDWKSGNEAGTHNHP